MDDDGGNDTDDPSDDNAPVPALSIVSRLCDNQWLHCWKGRYQTFAESPRPWQWRSSSSRYVAIVLIVLADIFSFYFDLTQDLLSEIYLYFEINAQSPVRLYPGSEQKVNRENVFSPGE